MHDDTVSREGSFSETRDATGHPVRPPRRRFQARAQGVLAILVAVLTLYTLGRFREAVAWGGILAIVCWPLVRRVRAHWASRHADTLIPAGVVVAIGLAFAAPVLLIGTEVAKETHDATQWFQQARQDGIPAPAWLGELPYEQAQAQRWWQANLADPSGVQDLMHRLKPEQALGTVEQIGHGAANGTVLLMFSLLVLFFLLRSGREVSGRITVLTDRLFGVRGEMVLKQIVGAVRGSMAGLVLVGLGEGVLIGISYVIAGAPQPLLLGILTAVASMIPMLGGFAVAIAVLLILMKGSVGAAVAVGVFGLLVLFLADHFIRPVLIGGSIRLPFVWVLLGILGGLETWGLVGLFVGPVLMAVAHLIWRFGSARGMLRAGE
ncbi:AI-2E family transporter [Acetobacter oeni]|uniref:AI-2E family transporter n=1 Tax=Acetobacter oeni TaxID=304077 RepID=A0A511XL17_9PROT|nr:AI-2E family transporter [Acetobacter oeni]MBB3883223.1 putative PurR-regulated permease PerM [Acetobacter oeni]NHO19289.1 AI-2E family transporter [Acetobacter oeni]GBR07265.1 permease [Acetobacter oeni LMG 21952]GEN63628.1 AI-2E family transporter [Acetobacter oeni]